MVGQGPGPGGLQALKAIGSPGRLCAKAGQAAGSTAVTLLALERGLAQAWEAPFCGKPGPESGGRAGGGRGNQSTAQGCWRWHGARDVSPGLMEGEVLNSL